MIGDQLRNKMIIFGHPKCINTAKCFQLAAEKGIDAEGKVIDVDNPDSDFLQTSPLGIAPALQDVKYHIAGTLSVLSYMDDKGFGPSLVPRNGVTRAVMYQWIGVAMERVQDNIMHDNISALAPALDALDQVLADSAKKGEFICGDFTLADIHWSACVNMLEVKGQGDQISSRSNMGEWFANVKAHSSTSKEAIIPFTAVPTADDIQNNTLRDISINV